MHWRNHLKFPEDSALSPEAKDLICRLLCDVEHRLGAGGANQIKVYLACPFTPIFSQLSDAGLFLSGTSVVQGCHLGQTL